MPTLEAGLFFLCLGLAFAFTFISFRIVDAARTGLRLLAIGLFLALAIIVGSGFEVAQTSIAISDQTIYNTDTGETWIENDTSTHSNIILSGGTDSYWLAWVFSGLGFMNLVFVVKEMGLGK